MKATVFMQLHVRWNILISFRLLVLKNSLTSLIFIQITKHPFPHALKHASTVIDWTLYKPIWVRHLKTFISHINSTFVFPIFIVYILLWPILNGYKYTVNIFRLHTNLLYIWQSKVFFNFLHWTFSFLCNLLNAFS